MSDPAHALGDVFEQCIRGILPDDAMVTGWAVGLCVESASGGEEVVTLIDRECSPLRLAGVVSHMQQDITSRST